MLKQFSIREGHKQSLGIFLGWGCVGVVWCGVQGRQAILAGHKHNPRKYEDELFVKTKNKQKQEQQ